MSSCSPTSDCFKASFQFKLDKATGKVNENTTQGQWLNGSDQSSPGAASPPKSVDSGKNFDAAG